MSRLSALGQRGMLLLWLALLASSPCLASEKTPTLEQLVEQAFEFTRQGSRDLAIETYLKAYDKAKVLGMTREMGRQLASVGGIFNAMGQYQKALDYYDRALKYFIKAGAKRGIHGITLRRINPALKADKAGLVTLAQIDEAVAYFTGLGKPHNSARALRLKAKYLHLTGDQPNAGIAFEQALDFARQIPDSPVYPNVLQGISSYYLKNGHYHKAIEAAQILLQISNDEQLLNARKGALSVLAQAHRTLGNHDKAWAFILQYIDKSNALNEKKLKNKIQQADAKFQISETRHAMQQLEGEKQLQQILAEQQANQKTLIALVAVVILLLSWILYSRQRQQHRLAAEQSKVLRDTLDKKNELLANISHEFKTPLTLIYGPLQMALQHLPTGQAKEQLTIAKRNTQRLSRMVEQILDLAKLDIQTPAAPQPLNLSELLTYLTSAFESLYATHQMALSREIEPGIHVKIDPEAGEKIIVNLIGNALKYSPANTGVLVTLAAANDGKAILKIADQGIGIAPQDMDRVFERFVRLDQIHHTGVEGSGIGLTLTKELVEQAGGTIELTSELNVGTTFTVTLPGCEAEQNETSAAGDHILRQEIESFTPQPQTALPQSPPQSERPQLLIVDDNADIRQFVASCLSDEFDCHFAEDGQQGLNMAIEQVPDLIVTDLMMPNKSGFELAAELRADIRTSHIPIIMLTAKGDDQSRLQAWKSDIDAYLSKPFIAEELQARAKHILHIRRLLSRRIGAAMPSADQQKSLDGLSAQEKQFLQKLNGFVEKHYADAGLELKTAASALNMSERQLQRKLKALLDQTLRDYLRVFRLEKAAQRLKQGQQITKVSMDVGFTTANYFSQCFKAHFGVSPSQFQRDG